MRCEACGAEQPNAAKFCGTCGSSQLRRCAVCSTEVPAAANFCLECGAGLTGGAPATSAPVPIPDPRGTAHAHRGLPVPVAQRRWVSVLFCDLVGFTTLAEARDPEDVRELLSAYFEIARSVVERYGGTVEKFIGDAVMAVWGVPVANEDDAERAVRTALELVSEVRALGDRWSVPGLLARVGVLSGEGAVNIGAVGEGMVAGDLVNSASRLQSAAAPGTVLVGEGTYLAARDAIAFEEVGELTVKGKFEPVLAWRALRVVARRRGVARSEGVEAPFVGRREELRLLTDLLHATAREGRARLVSVTGIAGIGKSRLAWELLKYADGLADTVYWHHGRSPAYGEGIAFWALAEMVRMRAGIAEGEDPGSARQKLEECVVDIVSDDEERRWLAPRLFHLLGLADAPPGERQELFSAWRTFFERIAGRGPVVLVFEDLHWADSGLLDFVESVADWSRHYPILLLTLARPELAERRPNWGTTVRSFTSLRLEALAPDAMRELLSGLVRGLPADAADATDRLVARAEGVPLYAVETVRALADRGVLVRSEGSDTYELCGTLGDVELPATLHALVASRLDALPTEERALVQDASVLGKTFSPAALTGVSGIDEATLAERLTDLVRREVLGFDADPRSPGRGQYGFLQAIAREVAYATLSKHDRRAKHLSAARFFESIGDEELAGVVASHSLDAYRATPAGPEADALASRARDWLGRACARARSLGSTEEALVHAEQALEVSPPGTERARLLELAGETAELASEHERAITYLEEAADFYEGAGDAIGQSRAISLLAEALGFGLGRFAEAIQRAEPSFAALEASAAGGPDADTARARLAWALAWACTHSGDCGTGLEWSERALDAAERLDDGGLLARALSGRASALFGLGRHREAALLAGVGYQLAGAAGSLSEQGRAKLLESLFVADDDPRRSIGSALEAAALARRAGDRGSEVLTLLNAVELGIFMGDWATARRVLDELGDRHLGGAWFDEWRDWCAAALAGLALDPAEALGAFAERELAVGSSEFVAERTTYLRFRSAVHLAAGETERAVADASAAVAADPAGINSAIALGVQARAALWRRDVPGAQEALDGMSRFRGRWTGAARLTVSAGLVALDGRPDDAATTYGAAANAWRSLGVPLELALCGLDATRLLGVGDAVEGSVDAAVSAAVEELVADLAGQARVVLAGLGAIPFLAMLDAHGAAGAAEQRTSQPGSQQVVTHH
jgi:class 3 adenylate cyclase/tetratricopeptide (TPR) repeat protein